MKISVTSKRAAVLGHPVSHSKSPLMHNSGFRAAGIDAVYTKMDVAPARLGDAISEMRAMGFLGASITVPHKTAVMTYCDSLSAAAKAVGAVNTLEFRLDGSLVGHNTDAAGFVRAFEEASGHRIADRRIVLLGAGGAARAVSVGVREAGAASVSVVARTPASVGWTTAHPWNNESLEQLLSSCDLLVDCTSIGLDAASERNVPVPIEVQHLPETAIVCTLIYHRKTDLLVAAEERGLQTVDGEGMLLHQGALAFEIWTGTRAPIEPMRAALLRKE